MSVRKREWGEGDGKRFAWVVDYCDGSGKRRLKTFKRQKDATDWAAKTHVDKGDGMHVPDSASITVKQAGEDWIASAERDKLERATVAQYKQHLKHHINPYLGATKLTRLTLPLVTKFDDDLHKDGRSDAMRRVVLSSLGALIGHAQLSGRVGHNVIAELRTAHRHKRKSRDKQERRHKGKLKVGVDIPAPDEVRALLAAAEGRWRVLLLTAVFTGLRASELRGLSWPDVDLKKGRLHVNQRADRYNEIGPPKSAAGTRTIPLPPTVVNELRQWKLTCPKHHDKPGDEGRLWLVFPNGQGHVESHSNILKRGLQATMLAAKLAVPRLDRHKRPMRDQDGQPILRAKYTGMHALRHFFASWCINRKVDGGLELPPKIVQARLGHESFQMTMDTYGHLFPQVDDSGELAAAAQQLLGS